MSTIRHEKCSLLLNVKKTRCSMCEAHRKSLLVMLKRLSEAGTSAKSHTNYRYMTSPLLSQRCSELQKNCSSLQRKVDRLKKKVERLLNDNGKHVSTNLNEDLKVIMSENFAKISEQYPENTFERTFWEQHATHSKCKDGRGFRWHPAMIKWCLYLRHLSGKGYETLRQSGVLKLPSQRTLRDYTHYIPATTGFSAKVDEMLMSTMKVHTIIICILTMLSILTLRSRLVPYINSMCLL